MGTGGGEGVKIPKFSCFVEFLWKKCLSFGISVLEFLKKNPNKKPDLLTSIYGLMLRRLCIKDAILCFVLFISHKGASIKGIRQPKTTILLDFFF